MSDVGDDVGTIVPDCVTEASVYDGKYVVVEDGKIKMQTNCIHDARYATTLDRSLWRLSLINCMPPTQVYY